MGKNGCRQSSNQLNRRVKCLTILVKHVQNFQRAIILKRRQQEKLMQSRRASLRKFYLLNFLELESRLLGMALLSGINGMEPDNLNEIEGDASKETFHIASPNKIIRNPRQNLRFYEDVCFTYSDEKFLQTFRMSRRTFQLLCDQLRDALQPNAPIKNLISLETRCALSLYAFAAGDDYRVIASLFGLSRTSVCKFTKKFAEALLEKLGPHLLTMPRDEEEYREIRNNFQRASGLPPLCVGILGACEINVSPQFDEAPNYANVAGATTLVLQALVDDKMLFRKVQMEAQRPTMLINAPNEITKLGVRQYKEHFLPCFVVAPAEYYTPQTWLIQPYKCPKTSWEIKFNDAINKLQSIKQEAFQRFFSRWKILQRKGDLEPKTMILIANACFALHNLLEEYEENFDYSWTEGVNLSHFDELIHCKEISSTLKTTEVTKKEALAMRNLLAREVEKLTDF